MSDIFGPDGPPPKKKSEPMTGLTRVVAYFSAGVIFACFLILLIALTASAVKHLI